MSIYDNNGLPGPDGVSVAKNIEEAKNYASTHDPITTFAWFLNKEKGGGDWDYRGQGEAQGLGVTAWQDIGNFNFGAVGTAIGHTITHNSIRVSINRPADFDTERVKSDFFHAFP